MDNYLDNIFKDVDDTIKLDDEQKRVVLDDSKNILVIAGAGSGKTTVITAKVKYLIDIKKVNPKDILIISFTTKATDELKERINDVFKLDVDISTFHSLAYKIVKKFNWGYDLISDYNFIIESFITKNKDTKNMIKLLKKDKVYKKDSHKYHDNLKYFINYTVENFNLYRMKCKDSLEDSYFCKYYVYLEKLLLFIKEYQIENRFMDYEDMIILASNLLYIVGINYRYVIIDEFQDISFNRYMLIKKISKLYNSNIMVVGDDWQAIYSFAGSDNNLFLNFQKDMKASVHKITRTYRNSNQLINVAGSFIMKNKKQIVKELKSHKDLDSPVIIYYYLFNPSRKVKNIVDEIINIYGVNKNILILGRYKKDINIILGQYFSIKDNIVIYKKNKKVIINYMTVHSSKGLGYDNVILLINKENPFPSTIKESVVRKELLPSEEKILEERRLFYVAMTRTKNRFYIVCNYFKESIFIKEINEYENVIIKKKSS